MVPAGQPVHRALSGLADAGVRLDWLQRIFASLEQVRVLDWEVKAAHPVPTIATLRRLHTEHPGCEPVLLLGADAFSAMSSWVDYPAHLDLCDVAVFPRHGQAVTPGDWQPASLHAWRRVPGHGRVIRVETLLPDVSATAIRRLAAQGRSLRGFVPDVVRQEIEGAYGAGSAMTGDGM